MGVYFEVFLELGLCVLFLQFRTANRSAVGLDVLSAHSCSVLSPVRAIEAGSR